MSKLLGTWHITDMEQWSEDYFNDEHDEASGSGWLGLKDKNTLEGHIKFHQSDSSLLSAKRV